MSEWRPIETAPKDGTRVDLWASWDDCGVRLANAFWDTGRRFPGWVISVNDYGVLDERQFTHWMPLPAPPMTPTITRDDALATYWLDATKAETFEALKRVRDRFFPADQPERDRDEMWDMVNEVIAKAEGRRAPEEAQ